MKNRKPPIVLGTCLVVMLLAVGIIYAPHGTKSEEEQAREAQQQAQQQADPNAERPKLSSGQASDFVKQQMGGATPGNGQPSPKMAKMAGAEHSSIERVKSENYKPKPNDSSTSTQWYTPETQK